MVEDHLQFPFQFILISDNFFLRGLIYENLFRNDIHG